jgi:alpha-beta hydrolase superfamily lysophospholipase
VNWGGWNRVGTRKRGAALLSQHLRESSLSEGERRFVIAHSHGGNVAMYAVRDKEAAARTAGIVTLATPFLVAQRRHFALGMALSRSQLG